MDPLPMTAAGARVPVLAVEQLCIAMRDAHGGMRRIVDAVDLTIHAGQIVALVGESGSGKTTVGRAILQLLPASACVEQGSIRFQGRELLGAGEAALRAVRGRAIGMVFQEPLVSLNPAMTVGAQMTEALVLHGGVSGAAARARCLEMLERVRIKDAAACFNAYPHQFSGGMRQRIMLASVMLTRPRLLIADEPTSALDSLSQKEVMDIMVELARAAGSALLLVSHDLGLVARYADRVAVMRQGKVLEAGKTAATLLEPAHQYTRALLDCLPLRDDADRTRPIGAALIEIRGLCVPFERKSGHFWKKAERFFAVNDVDLDICQGETLAVVGESGSGKTTIGRVLLRLARHQGGSIRFDGRDLASMDGQAANDYRRQTQMVFQDPFSALDPRMKLLDIVAEGLRNMASLSPQERRERAAAMLDEVGVPRDFAARFPHELSGGQRQRVCIARAIAGAPRFVVADEPVSALDLTIQKQILDLLDRLQQKFGFTYLFISHDLGVVEQIADRVAVMYRGRVVEIGPRAAIYGDARHPYTIALLAAAPRLCRTGSGGYRLAARLARQQPAPDRYAYFLHENGTGAHRAGAAPHMVPVGPGHRVACVPAP